MNRKGGNKDRRSRFSSTMRGYYKSIYREVAIDIGYYINI